MTKHTDLLGFNQNIDIDNLLREATCRQKSQELADSYSVEELQSRLDQIMMDMEQEAEPEGGPIADMYADEMDAYEGALRISKGGSDTPLTYDQAIGRVSRDDFEKSSKFDRNLGEQGFDDRLKNQMGMSDDEFEDQVASRDIETPFPGDDELTIGYSKASDLISKLRQDYRDMSDEDLDEFSKEMLLHFIDNTAAQAAAKVFFARKGLEEYDGGKRKKLQQKIIEPISISSGNCCVDTYGVGTTMGPIMYGDAMCYNAAGVHVGDVSVNSDGSCP